VAVHFSWREDTQATELVGVLYFWFTQNSALASGPQTCKMQLSPFGVATLLTRVHTEAVRTVSCKTPDYSQIFLKGIIPNFAVALPDAVKYERIIELVIFCSRQSLCLSMY